MKYCTAILAALVFVAYFSSVSLAHKVNVFAYPDGDAIQVECYFSRSQKVRYGKLTITDLATGEKLLEGTTDEQGLFRFPPDTTFLKTGHGMNILLNSGEGHQNTWQLSPEELAALSPAGQSTKLPGDRQPARERHSSQPPANGSIAISSIEDTELEALIGKVMDAKLASIKQSLARQEDNIPQLRDIIGGIGWILGLLGLATYMKYRR